MNERIFSLLVLLFLFTSTISSASPRTPREMGYPFNLPAKNTIYVDDDNIQGPWNGSYEYPYRSISDGILQATTNDMVFVFNGCYYETVRINKTIDLHGEQQNSTVIDGQYNGSVITITGDYVDICGFTIRNSGGYQGNAGISVGANLTTITACTFYRTRTGISLQNIHRPLITSCRFHTNGYGIHSNSSTFITLDQCLFYHNGIGAYFYEAYDVKITDSYAETNGIGFLCERSSIIHISKSAACDNDDNEGGMVFEQCNRISLFNSYLAHNGFGVSLINSSDWNISFCNFSLNTHFACKLKNSISTNDIFNCKFTGNIHYGIYAENSIFSVSFTNFYRNEDYGLYAKSSIIDARNNWWNSSRGPAYTGLARADRATWSPLKIRLLPWLLSPLANIGPYWDLQSTFQNQPYSNPWPEEIAFPDSDTDNDNVPDWWELKWGYNPAAWDDHQHLDPDRDSLNNIEECFMDYSNSNPFFKDVFLEFDWTKSLIPNVSNKPPVQEITQMIDAFTKQNITLHVDTGELGGGEELPAEEFVSYADIIDLYWDYFLHNELNNPRQRIFRYGIICDHTEGTGFAVVGWDHLNSFVIGAQFLTEKYPNYGRERMMVTSAMHEVGHTFGLIVTKYNGIDNHVAMNPLYKEYWIYSRYKSMLNYAYTFSMMDFSDGSHGPGDYDDWGNLDFSFFKNTRFEYPILQRVAS